MSTPTPSQQAPQVQHSFDGDVKILNSTFDKRMEMRKGLTVLQQDLTRMEDRPIQIKAEIKIRVGGQDPKEHVYMVNVTSPDFDLEAFTRLVSSSTGKAAESVPSATQELLSSPNVSKAVNGQRATPVQSTPRPDSRNADVDIDVIEIRPFKRARKDSERTPSVTQDKDVDQVQRTSNRVDQMFAFIKEWHSEWVRQGGWLFDNVTKSSNVSNGLRTALEKRMDTVQDVLGQSLNTASGNTMGELQNISKLIPWLEHCRKTSADKVQAREEKWRSSSATFHDQSRREREAAEKRIERKVEEQKELLRKLARASGVDLDETDDMEVSSTTASREQSLGAQLTRELNMEAAKSGDTSKTDAEPETINIDD